MELNKSLLADEIGVIRCVQSKHRFIPLCSNISPDDVQQVYEMPSFFKDMANQQHI